jgi:hypothetical protein
MEENLENTPDLSIITSADAIRGLGTTFVGTARRGFRGLNRSIRRYPSLEQQLDRSGGLNSIINRASTPTEEDEVLDFASSLQTGLFIDQFTNGDLDSIPAVQEMMDGINNGNKIATGIGEHLDACCDDLKQMLRELRKLTKNLNSNVISQLNNTKNTILDRLNTIRTEILEFYNSEKSSFINNYVTEKEATLAEIRGILQEELAELKTEISNLKQKVVEGNIEIKNEISKTKNLIIAETRVIVQNELEELSKQISSVDKTVKDTTTEIKESVSKVKEDTEHTKARVDTIVIEFSEYVVSWDAWVALDAAFKETISTGLVALAGEVASGFTTVEFTLKRKYILNSRNFHSTIVNQTKLIYSQIDSGFKGFKEYTDVEFEELPSKTGMETSLLVVGEAYARWDSVTTYFPCIIFVFNEDTTNKYKRRSQIKLRLRMQNKDLNDTDILSLKNKIKNSFKSLEYIHGPSRGYYVSADKRFKTTIYEKDKNTQQDILKKLCGIIDEDFNTNLLSTTKINSKRPNITKRLVSLDGTTINTVNYDMNFTVKLKKVALLVNGMQKPIVLFHGDY